MKADIKEQVSTYSAIERRATSTYRTRKHPLLISVIVQTRNQNDASKENEVFNTSAMLKSTKPKRLLSIDKRWGNISSGPDIRRSQFSRTTRFEQLNNIVRTKSACREEHSVIYKMSMQYPKWSNKIPLKLDDDVKVCLNIKRFNNSQHKYIRQKANSTKAEHNPCTIEEAYKFSEDQCKKMNKDELLEHQDIVLRNHMLLQKLKAALIANPSKTTIIMLKVLFN